MSLFDEFVSEIDNKYASIASDGLYADTHGFVDTGSYILNTLYSGSIYGGFPSNKISVLAGEEATGKTFFMLSVIKHFLETNKQAGVFLFESEGAITKDLLESRNIDSNRVFVIPVSTVQDFSSQCTKILKKYIESKNKTQKFMMCLDSLGMLSTNKEKNDMLSGADKVDMTRAKLIKGSFRALTLDLSIAGIPLLVTNHVYDTQDLFSKKIMSGGKGAMYSASNILFLSKSKAVNKTTKEIIGANIRCKVNKSRFVKEGLIATVLLNHKTGLDRYYGLIEVALACGVFKKVSTRIELPNGEKVFEKAINEEPEKYFTKDILDTIDKYTQENYVYGGLSVDTEEVLDEILGK